MNQSKGQVMILTTLVLSGTVLAGITIAGLLMLYQIRQSGNAVQSGRAIYVADAGFEYEMYRLYQGQNPTDAICTSDPPHITLPHTELHPSMVPSGNDVLINSGAVSGKTTRSIVWTFSNFLPQAKCLTSSSPAAP